MARCPHDALQQLGDRFRRSWRCPVGQSAFKLVNVHREQSSIPRAVDVRLYGVAGEKDLVRLQTEPFADELINLGLRLHEPHLERQNDRIKLIR